MEATSTEFYMVTIALNVVALGVASSVSDLSLVNGLNGAICTNLVAFVLPVVFYLKIRNSPSNGDAPVAVFSASNLPYFGILAFGVVSLVYSTAQIVQRFAE